MGGSGARRGRRRGGAAGAEGPPGRARRIRGDDQIVIVSFDGDLKYRGDLETQRQERHAHAPVSPLANRAPESKSRWARPAHARPRRPPEANRSVEDHIRPTTDWSIPVIWSPGATDCRYGRELGIPLAWSERLSSATPEQRANYRIEEFGAAIHWPDVDEEIALTRFLGVSEDVLYDALGFNSPTRSTQEYLALAD